MRGRQVCPVPYDPRVHHRRSIRLQGYDYSLEGAYFVTICTQNRQPLLGEVTGGAMRLSDAGQMVQEVWDALPDHYPGVEIDAIQVMPNHVHGIVVLCAGVAQGDRRPRDPTELLGRTEDGRCAISLPAVLERFKSLTTTLYCEGVKGSGWPRFDGRLWQRNYYEHVIRDERELNLIRQYIADNPAAWEFDKENPECKRKGRAEPWEV